MKTVEQLKKEVAEAKLPQATKDLFNNVLNRANEAALSDDDKTIYDSDLKNYMDTMSCIEYAVIKGLKDGEEKGRAEEKVSIAKSMKADGIDVQAISKYTGLTPAEIEAL